MNDAIEEQRLMLLEQLRALHQHYQVLAKPIIDQLVRLENMRPPKPFIVPVRLGGEPIFTPALLTED